MCVLRYESSNLKDHLQRARSVIYDNMAETRTKLKQHCTDVARGLAYLSQLKVQHFTENNMNYMKWKLEADLLVPNLVSCGDN